MKKDLQILKYFGFMLLAVTILVTTAKAQEQGVGNKKEADKTESNSNSGSQPNSTTNSSPAGDANNIEANKAVSPVGAKPTPSTVSEGKITRWLELQTATLGFRHRWIENSRDLTTNKQLQHSEVFRGRFKFDPKGNYSVNANLASGTTFTSGWNNTGVGTGDGVTNLYLKQLFFSAKPITGVEVQYGGLYIARGESTEITSYDNDGYIVGERLSLRRPKDLFFDELSVTYGYLGDLNNPNVFDRFDELDKSNYHQFLVLKSIGKRASVSADYTFQSGVETLREAVKLNTKELKAVDNIRLELYQRLDVNKDAGFAIGVEKLIKKKLTLGGGYAQIDRAYGGLNADRFNRGKRLFFNGTYTISPEFSVTTFVTRAFDIDYAIPNKTRVDLIFSYNLLKSLQRTGIF
jgi:hypothetical protein